MSWEAVGAIGEVVGAFGVIATLMFLGLQIRANTRTTKASAFDSVLSEHRAKLRGVFAVNPDLLEVWMKGMVDIDALSPREQRMFNMLLSEDALFVENIIHQHANQNIDVEQLTPWLDYFSAILRSPGGQKWWVETKNWFNPNLQRVMDPHIVETHGQPTLLDHKYWAAELQEVGGCSTV